MLLSANLFLDRILGIRRSAFLGSPQQTRIWGTL